MRKILTSSLVFLVSISNVVPYLPQMIQSAHAVGINEVESKKEAEIVQNSEVDKLTEFVDFYQEIEEAEDSLDDKDEEKERLPLKEGEQAGPSLEEKSETPPSNNEIEVSETTNEMEKNTGSGLIRDLFPDPIVAEEVAGWFNRTVNDTVSIENDLKPFIGTGQNRYIEMRNMGIRSIEGLQYFENIHGLLLEGNQLTDIAPLAQFSSLTALSLSRNNITDINMLSSHTGLTELYLNNNSIENTNVLYSLRNLTHLNLNNNEIKHLDNLELMGNMVELSVMNNEITGSLISLSSMNKLEELYIHGNNITSLDEVSSLENLTILWAGDNKIKQLPSEFNLPNLVDLGLNMNQLEDISSLASLTNVAELNLGVNNIKDLTPLSQLENLVNLRIQRNKVTDMRPIAPLIVNGLIVTGHGQGLELPAVKLGESYPINLVDYLGNSPVMSWTNQGNLTSENLTWESAGNNSAAFESTSHSNVVFNGTIEQEVTVSNPLVKDIFPDPNLAQAVAELFNRTVNDEISIVHELNTRSGLILNDKGIKSLEGMEHFISVDVLGLHNNEIISLEPLRNLPRLSGLFANNNQIEDLEPIWDKGFDRILVSNNRITDLPESIPVLRPTNHIDISNNQISDIRILAEVTLSNLDASNQEVTLPQSEISEGTFFELYSVNDTSVEIDWLNIGSLTENQLSWGRSGLNQMTFSSEGSDILFSGTVSQEVTGKNPLISELFPDPNLAQAVAELFNRTVNDEISIVHELNTHVDTIAFNNRQISQLDGMEYFSGVISINLRNNQIRDIGILTSNLSSLRTLRLEDNQISDLPNEINLPNLGSLFLGNNEIKELPNEMNLSRLHSLNLDRNEIENIQTLANLPMLQSLSLSSNKIVDISPLSELTQLRDLWSNNNMVENISPLSELNQLGLISLSNNKVVDISPLKNMNSLSALSIDRNMIEDVSPLSELTRLTRLILSSNQISNIASLSNLTNLGTLSLSNNKIEDISYLSELNRLNLIELGGNQISDISPLPKLSTTRVTARNQTITLNPVFLGAENPFKLATLDGIPMQTDFRTEGALEENQLTWFNSGSNNLTFDGSGETESGQSVTFSGTVTQEVILDFGLTAVPESFEFGRSNGISSSISHIQSNSSEIVTVEDNRTDQLGWRLQVRMTELTSSTNNRLTGTTMSLKTAFTETAGGEVPHLFDTLTINNANRQLVSANPGEGTGKWSIGFNQLTLNVPGSVARAGESYTGNVTWTLLNTP